MNINLNKKLSITELFQIFSNEQKAIAWMEKPRWGKEPICPRCDQSEVTRCKNKKHMPFWCKPCRKHFSVKTGTELANSKISMQKWVIAIYS